MNNNFINPILSIPGNELIYKKLKNILKKKSAIAFLGAGVSAPLYPLWNQLLHKLIDETVLRGLASESDKQFWIRSSISAPAQVASRIRSKLGDPTYHALLFETFKDRNGSDGLPYTQAQAAVMKTNFKAWITTNYDPGILEARRTITPSTKDTSFSVWNQNFRVNQWASGDIFKLKQSQPILFAHGHFNDPQNIVLDSENYRRAYQTGPYRRLFQNLWHQEHLIFVGFSFNDSVLSQIANEVLEETARLGGGEPRHIAIIGIPEDHIYTEEMRKTYSEKYHANALFYPIKINEQGKQDHSILTTILESLSVNLQTPKNSNFSDGCPLNNSKQNVNKQVIEKYVHETTDDSKFTGRLTELARLNSWGSDSNVRLITITAIGGLGKTSLLGHWLKSGKAILDCSAEGIFFWSFYRDDDIDHLFDALLNFAQTSFSFSAKSTKFSHKQNIINFINEHKLIIVLDGLEVVQESLGTIAFGKLLQRELAEFLHAHCSNDGESLVILTSRFPFPDLTPYLGDTLRTLPLPELCPFDGGQLLSSFGVKGWKNDRENISINLGGHPLALRIFARSMPSDLGRDPTRLWQRLFSQKTLAENDTLESKLHRLLSFYEERLPKLHSQALSLVALFRMPVSQTTLKPLWDKLFKSDDEKISLNQTLDELHREHLLTADIWPGKNYSQYTCHPILRDHFRGRLLGEQGLAKRAANLLANQPDAQDKTSLDFVSIVGTAIEALLESSEFIAADDLYKNRLENGNIFTRFLAPHLGFEVTRQFVRDRERKKLIVHALGNERFGFYLNSVGMFAKNAGEPEFAYEFYLEAMTLYQKHSDSESCGTALGRLTEIQISLGNIRVVSSSYAHINDALELKNNTNARDLIDFAAYLALLQGDLQAVDFYFKKSHRAKRKNRSQGVNVQGLGNFVGAEFFLRIGKIELALEAVNLFRKFAVDAKSIEQVARCDLMLARINILKKSWIDAKSYLDHAKSKFDDGHMIYDLVCLLAAEAEISLNQKNWAAAESAIERAYQMAAPRKYRLIQADILNLRARFFIEQRRPNISVARDAAESSLQLAEFCGYIWAERDACNLLIKIFQKLDKVDEMNQFQHRVNKLNNHLKENIEIF